MATRALLIRLDRQPRASMPPLDVGRFCRTRGMLPGFWPRDQGGPDSAAAARGEQGFGKLEATAVIALPVDRDAIHLRQGTQVAEGSARKFAHRTQHRGRCRGILHKLNAHANMVAVRANHAERRTPIVKHETHTQKPTKASAIRKPLPTNGARHTTTVAISQVFNHAPHCVAPS